MEKRAGKLILHPVYPWRKEADLWHDDLWRTAEKYETIQRSTHPERGQNRRYEMNHRLIYMTASSADEARMIGRVLVEERLAACVNVLGSMESIYWWHGAVETSNEVAAIAKTRAELVDTLTARVVQLHSYDCPCVVVLPIERGHVPFLQWIDAETTGQPEN